MTFSSVITEAQTRTSKYDRSDYDNIYFKDSDTLRLYSETFSGLEALDSVVGDYKVFITGENHTYTESNARLWLKMIKYLHANAGVRNIMFEYGYSYGWLVNEYLQTGDTVLYNSLRNFAYVEYSDVLKDLYEYNASLDSSEKIYLCAIDIERGVYPIAKLLDYLITDTIQPHDSIVIHVQSIQSLASYNDSKLLESAENDYVGSGWNYRTTSTLELVQENFKKFESEYKEILGDNFDLFKEVITTKFDARALWTKYETEKAVQQYVFRENYMHTQFLKESEEHPGNWFGQFGRCHTTQNKTTSNSCDWYRFNSLANRIKNTKGGTYKDSVMTIGIIYKTDRSINMDNDGIEDEFDKYFEEMPNDGIVLFDFSEDEVLDSVYSDDFNYLFLSTNNQRGEVYEYLTYLDDYSYNNVVRLTFHLNQKNIGLGSLNDEFSGTDQADGFGTDPLQAIELTVLYGTRYSYDGLRTLTGSQFGYYLPRSVDLDNGPNYKLGGFYVRNLSYFNLLPRSTFFDAMPGLGIGYERLTLSADEETNNPSVNNGFIANTKNTVYTNPAITLDLLFRADVNISVFTLGVQYGYGFDLSKKNWRSGGDILESSPETSFRGSSLNYFVGFTF
ncbi:erythromycin esterase family protein [bacterium]|nr:erythromycin esterase family protein [bacterium]